MILFINITDACSACFEQRTVFTQQVLAKALNQMVDQTPLPLLFMRTVIQAIDAFPALVDFVMEILSKLVTRQVWRMPKLWVGFLKCVYQTQPRSFHVLLQLPPQQLEGALNRHANLRGPLASYANQPTIKSTLSRRYDNAKNEIMSLKSLFYCPFLASGRLAKEKIIPSLVRSDYSRNSNTKHGGFL
ncbi:symplekin [Vigna unguiculata]|uniref:Symplekin n=1 Tax=Vigna unguiculata TaxID=3917 RepID=A0A4D6NTL1_VIGUN|nr:symplekin [Vigna unguiculata]